MSEMRSERLRKLWEDDDYRKAQSERSREQILEQWKNQDFREMMIEMWNDPEHIAKISEMMIEMWEDLDYRNAHTGENNSNWKGGITPWRKAFHHSQLYRDWRQMVFERDNFTCQMCDVRGGDLEAHHIRPVRENKNSLLLFDVNNGITLCTECHKPLFRHEEEFEVRFNATIAAQIDGCKRELDEVRS